MGNSEFTIYTLGKTTEGIYNEKGSKFIGIAFPISSELDFLKKSSRKFK
jgi:putative IMPACT (imprinted ancient) family translation regulator